jgi:peptidoglycan hydrolase-like protein with peptidoglycan-binding domain
MNSLETSHILFMNPFIFTNTQFGDGTMNALKAFQACSGLPESGVCDARTW